MSDRNLLVETLEIMKANGKFPEDVRWIGATQRYNFQSAAPVLGTWADFAKVADFEYDAGYGGAEIEMDLVIVGGDWWLERGEYDGSEWWEFKSLPVMPTVPTQPITAESIKDR